MPIMSYFSDSVVSQRRFFTHRRPRQESEKKYWVLKSNTENIFDELFALSKQKNECILQTTSRDTVYDIITSGEEDLLDSRNKWIPNRNKRQKTIEDWNSGNDNQDASVSKRKSFKTRTSQLVTGTKKTEIESHSKFGSYSRDMSSHESSSTSRNSRGRWKHNKPEFHYPTIISDISSDEDDTLFEVISDIRRRNYQHFATYDPEHKLADQVHKKIFRRHKFVQNNYPQRKDHMKSNLPKKHSLKPSLDKIRNSNSQLRRITSNHSIKYSLDKFKENNSQSHRISSIKEVNCVQTLQSNVQEQIFSVKNEVLSERKIQIAAAQKKNKEMVSSTKYNDLLPELTYVKKLEIQNQTRREIEYLRAVPEDDLSTPDLNLLCSCKENDAQEHLLLNKNLSCTEKVKQIQTTKVLTLLPFNEEPVFPFSPSEENNSEISYTTSPPVSTLTLSHSSPEIRKTSTPVYSHLPGICFSPSPVKSSGKVDETSSASGSTKNSHILPSSMLHNIKNEKDSLRRITLRQKKNNYIEMGFPNPIGTNKCWMNSSLQAIFGMKPFIEDAVNIFEKSNIVESREKYSSLLEKFIGVVKARQRRNQLQLNRNLELLYQSLGVLNEHFTTHSQEDAVEFLTEFFSALREEFTRLCNNEVCTTPAGNCQQKHNIITNDMNSCQQDQSNTYIEQKNPVNENIIFKLKENHSCVMCSKHNSKETEHMTLIVNIPSEAFKEISLQEALERCMVTETRELRCVQCESQQCRVMTMFTLLPRFLILHVNRFQIQNNVIKKVCNYLKIPITLTVKNVISKTETIMPLQWMSADHKRFSWSKEREMSSCPPQKNNKGEKFQRSMEDPKVVKNRHEYTLVAIISHKGDTPNSGHYEADVYNVMTRNWNHYNDEIVTSETEEEVTGFSQQENGYAFLYMHKPLFIQLVNEHKISRNFENE